jgi:hypothetical protein
LSSFRGFLRNHAWTPLGAGSSHVSSSCRVRYSQRRHLGEAVFLATIVLLPFYIIRSITQPLQPRDFQKRLIGVKWATSWRLFTHKLRSSSLRDGTSQHYSPSRLPLPAADLRRPFVMATSNPLNRKRNAGFALPNPASSIITFLVEGQQKGPRKRAKFDPIRRQEVKAVRQRRACLRCSFLKLRVRPY